MIKQLLNSVDLLITDNSRYFTQPRPIIFNYFSRFHSAEELFKRSNEAAHFRCFKSGTC